MAASGTEDAGRVNGGAVVRAFLEGMPAFRLYGARVVGFEAGRSELEIPFRKELTFDGVTIQAGISAALLDFAGASAAATLLPEGWTIATTGFEVHNTAPARGERLVALGAVLDPNKSLGVARADVFAERDGERTLCATGLVTTRGFAPRGPR